MTIRSPSEPSKNSCMTAASKHAPAPRCENAKAVQAAHGPRTTRSGCSSRLDDAGRVACHGGWLGRYVLLDVQITVNGAAILSLFSSEAGQGAGCFVGRIRNHVRLKKPDEVMSYWLGPTQPIWRSGASTTVSRRAR